MLEPRSRSAGEDPDGPFCAALCEHRLKGAPGERALRCLSAAHARLAEAKRRLDESVSQRRAEDREPSPANRRPDREIAVACRAEGIP